MKRMLVALLGVIIFIGAITSFAGVCGDANYDGVVDILDVVYVINFKYKEGPDPYCGPPETGTVTDIDGNIYQTIKLCDQWWMAENLKVTHYRNGDPIPNVTDNSEWMGLSTGAYCEYDNDISHVATYGRLYNWYAIDDSRNIAPEGWHVPTDEEWKQMEMCLGMSQAEADIDSEVEGRGTDEGGKLKESGTEHWVSPNTGATNISEFTALPGGCRVSALYLVLGYTAIFYTSSGDPRWCRYLQNDDSQIWRSGSHIQNGLSIRCVKD